MPSFNYQRHLLCHHFHHTFPGLHIDEIPTVPGTSTWYLSSPFVTGSFVVPYRWYKPLTPIIPGTRYGRSYLVRENLVPGAFLHMCPCPKEFSLTIATEWVPNSEENVNKNFRRQDARARQVSVGHICKHRGLQERDSGNNVQTLF